MRMNDERWWLIWSWAFAIAAVVTMVYGAYNESLLCMMMFWMGQFMFSFERRERMRDR
jgi:hypothetical protein